MADVNRRALRIRYLERHQRIDRRIFRDRTNPLEYLEPEEVRERYRLFPETIMYLTELTEMERVTQRSHPLPALLSVLVSLHFLATNAHQIVTAQLHGVSRTSVSRAIKIFCNRVVLHLGQFVGFPELEGRRDLQKKFYNVAGFLHVVGAVDGTHIKFQAPTQHEDDFVNRKGFHSLNVQMICDANFQFIDIVAKWPGSVHDSRMFRESEICTRFERGEIDGVLLGDSGYPCRRYLMTLYQHTQIPSEERFNIAPCKTRVLIEQSFGVLKRRFPCLKYGLRVTPQWQLKLQPAVQFYTM